MMKKYELCDGNGNSLGKVRCGKETLETIVQNSDKIADSSLVEQREPQAEKEDELNIFGEVHEFDHDPSVKAGCCNYSVTSTFWVSSSREQAEEEIKLTSEDRKPHGLCDSCFTKMLADEDNGYMVLTEGKKMELFKKLEEIYQRIRFNDEFDKEETMRMIERLQGDLSIPPKKANLLTKELTDELYPN